MAFGFGNNRYAYLCLDRKRCFSILLLFNFLLAYIYYLHGQTYFPISPRIVTHLRQIDRNLGQKPNIAVQFIRDVLENEYDKEDLLSFYHTVDKEFSLGLRCARKTSQPSTTIVSSSSNLTDYEHNNTTTIRSLKTNPSPIRHSRRSSLYSFIINNSDVCSDETIDLVVIIISKSDNYKTRDAIRRTWGSGKNLGKYSSLNLKFFFLIDLDEKLSNNIRLENDLFHDIIQVELPQQYTLVTHRVLSLFEWSFRYCRSAKFLFKTDDDVFINLILLLKYLSPLINPSASNSFHLSEMMIYGYKHYNPEVFRKANDPVGARYVITIDEYPCRQYPDFLSGFGYLIPRKARDALVYASYRDRDTPFRISDVYLTGILPDYLSLPRQHMSNYNIRYQDECGDFFDHSNSFACAAGSHHGENSDVFGTFNRYWQRVRRSF